MERNWQNTEDVASYQVVPLARPLRKIAIVMVAIAVIFVGYAVFSAPAFQWQLVARYMFNPLILQGLWLTIWLTVVVMILAIVVGTLVALMRVSKSRFLTTVALCFVWLFRGPPILVQLILWYNMSLVFENITLTLPGIGTVFSLPTNDIMTPITAAIIALSLHEAGYMAEIVRGGLNSVASGQTEAALSLGMPPLLLMRRVVLPQAMRMIIPPTGNETINLLKTTSLVSIIAVSDLLYSAQSIYARTFETMPLLLVVTIWYLVVVTLMTLAQSYLEAYFTKDQRRITRAGFLRSFQVGFPARRKSENT
jgi:polar amino acid transport system permease protein